MDFEKSEKQAINTKLSKLSNVFTLEKRFESEFENCGEIGQGGFSKVYKVKHRLDETFYAIKALTIKNKDKRKSFSSSILQEELDKILSEIRYLAKLKDDCLVQYCNSWIEVDLIKDNFESCGGLTQTHYDSFDKKETSINNSYLQDHEDEGNSFIMFGDQKSEASSNIQNEYSGLKHIDHNYSPIHNQLDGNLETKEYILISNKAYPIKMVHSLRIYIQTELCEQNLSEYLAKNHKRNAKEQCNLFKDKILIFEQIANAVKWLHQHLLIHRDIKPSNVFITSHGKIKLGDLGLVTTLDHEMTCAMTDYRHQVGLQAIPLNPGSLRKNTFNYSSASTINSELGLSKNPKKSHTKNIGTVQYAAPEQLESSEYDQKVDIYSLGLVLFEILHPMKTLMEKKEKMTRLKKHYLFPSEFDSSKEMQLSKQLILKMVEASPNARLNIYEVISFMKSYLLDSKTAQSQINDSTSSKSCSVPPKNNIKQDDDNKSMAKSNKSNSSFSLNTEKKNSNCFDSNSRSFEMIVHNDATSNDRTNLKVEWKKM